MPEDPAIPNISDANAQHDRAHPTNWQPIRAGFRPDILIRRGKLTNQKIARYEKLGYYSANFRQARRELWSRRAAKRRSGNFDLTDDGRMIYRPS
jgi:hypothetical protein